MQIFKQIINELSSFQELKNCLDNGIQPISVTGVSQIHKAHIIYALERNGTTLVITDDENNAKKLCYDINEIAGQTLAHAFPSKELTLTNVEGVSREYENIRLTILSKVCTGECKFLVASIEAALQLTIPKSILINSIITIKQGDEIQIQELTRRLVECGYSFCETVEGTSQFSVRGAIVDIFPVQSDFPYRIEFWGDEVDNISAFDVESQRRTDSFESVSITPTLEIIADRETLAEKIEDFAKNVKGKRAAIVKEKLNNDANRLRNKLHLNNVDKYIHLAYDEPATVFDYITEAIIFNEYTNIAEKAKSVLAQHNEDIKLLLDEGELCKGLDSYYLEIAQFLSLVEKYPQIYLDVFMHGSNRINFQKLINFEAIQTASWGGEIRQLIEDLNSFCSRDYKVILFAGSEKTLPILANDLRESGINCDIATENSTVEPGRVLIMAGSLSGGFEYPEIKTALVTHTKAAHKKKKFKKHKKSEEIRYLSDISAGDLVVHSLYGIGRFIGIRKLEMDKITKDYITIEYAGKDKLYVPVTQLDMVSRYIGTSDETGVKLNKLSSTEWQRTRNNVKSAVKDIAKELIALYAKRENSKGFAFSPDSELQFEFEERFPYVETDDQLRCIEEIKSDMERVRPMDRLLCGDVGFGKTEVAFRAAFKCVLDGKQCAILVPTTVLAWQHYQTALKRFEHFPVNIELLSRFRTPKQQSEILKKLKTGKLDIIIGTHRLVQKDVEFKALGLAIIDEEQRFGVAHKEKFKEYFAGVDVLTLSATPIPRTLNMAMSGIRDMSIIEEPPQDRYPVQTYVIEHNMGIIVQAISKELKRGGQVYYIHNRIDTIARCAAQLQELLPDARISYAHGQMPEETMSEIWRQLVDHEIDILVCTTIIETGVDIPNVNTLIIEDADKFGLSQLYQLRGRVGRSNRRAYAYFTFRKGKVLTEVASKRLNAIREFTQFGSGFRIAMRDLEIRGAGNILSAKQHGHMEAVGYDMYLRLLSEAIAEEKGEPIQKAEDCIVDIQIEAHIPEKYIESLSQRLDVYRRIASISTEEESMDFIDELIDRYGEPPKAILGLIQISLLRNTAARLGISEISQVNNQLMFYTEHPSMEQLSALSDKFKGRIKFNSLPRPYIGIMLNANQKAIELMNEVLSTMDIS